MHVPAAAEPTLPIEPWAAPPSEQDFVAWAERELRRLQAKYDLHEWDIYLDVVGDKDMENADHAAELTLREPYRLARIHVSQALLATGNKALLLDMLEHEVQHIALYPLDALRSLVLDAVPPEMRRLIVGEFRRANERIRALLQRLDEQQVRV